MDRRQEEALAARAAGRELGSYEVVGKPLTHNGASHQPGAILSLHNADADILVARGRVALAVAKRRARRSTSAPPLELESEEAPEDLAGEG